MSNQSERWKPVLKPDGTYCSPGCGLGCTKAGHDNAVEAAQALAAQLGEGWEPHVWENLGWHFRARKGCCDVFSNQGGNYTAYLNATKQFVVSADDPVKAVEGAINAMDEFIAQLRADRAALAGSEVSP